MGWVYHFLGERSKAWHRRGVPWSERVRLSLLSMGRHFMRADVPAHGAAMAFNFFLSLIPLLAIIGYVLGLVLRRQGIELFFTPLLPAIPKDVRPLVLAELRVLSEASTAPAPFIAVGFVWASSSGLHGFLDGIEGVLEIPRRAFWRKRGIALLWTIASVIGLPLFGYVLLQLRHALPHGWFAPLLAVVLFFVGVFVLTLLYALAAPGYGMRGSWPGAGGAVGLWLAGSWGFSFYVRSLGNYSAYYGSLAAVAVLLLWCWLTAMALLLGAGFNHEFMRLRTGR